MLVSVARGKTVRFKWVESLRGNDGVAFVRSRGVAMEFHSYRREDCNAGAPPISLARAIVSLVATKKGRRHLAVHDVHVAFLRTDIDK